MYITKIGKLYERHVLNICGQINKTQENAMVVVNEESTLILGEPNGIFQSKTTTNNHFQY